MVVFLFDMEIKVLLLILACMGWGTLITPLCVFLRRQSEVESRQFQSALRL